WRAAFRVENLGVYCYRIIGWGDRFYTLRADLRKRADAGQDLTGDLFIGSQFNDAVPVCVARMASKQLDVGLLNAFAPPIARRDQHAQLDQAARYAAAMDQALLAVMDRHADRSHATISPEFSIIVDDERAAFSAWYELFPRCYAGSPGKHGTFRDLITH